MGSLTCLALQSFWKTRFALSLGTHGWWMKVNEKERKCRCLRAVRVNGGELRVYTSKHKHPALNSGIFWLDRELFQTGLGGVMQTNRAGGLHCLVAKNKIKKSYKLVNHLPDFCCRKIVFFMCFIHQYPPWSDSIGSWQKGEIREHRFYRPSCSDHKCLEWWFDVNCNLWSFSQTSVNGANCPRNFQTPKTHPLVTGPSLLSSQTINYQLPDTFSPPFTVRATNHFWYLVFPPTLSPNLFQAQDFGKAGEIPRPWRPRHLLWWLIWDFPNCVRLGAKL